MAALIPHSQSESPGSLARVMADLSQGVLAAVARVFKFTNRAVRQDAPESFDQYFADFAKTTPIVSVVFNHIGNNSVLHALNLHGAKNDVVSEGAPKTSVQ